ncbi:MAG: glutathione peroxidase [Alphaproteobacteria bacterium]|nr:glutathione peroxidase [Alphaproteobacteria bacterium]
MEKSAYAFTFQSIEGGELPLASFQGKTLLVVNTASNCGFTPQYEGLQALWTEFKDQGLVIIGVPSNDFGGQEPGTADEIKTFCEGTYSIDFPLTEKVVVKGDQAHPFYKWAAAVLGEAKAPRWNFHKYLVDSNGTLIGSFPSTVRPGDEAFRNQIKAALPNS